MFQPQVRPRSPLSSSFEVLPRGRVDTAGTGAVIAAEIEVGTVVWLRALAENKGGTAK